MNINLFCFTCLFPILNEEEISFNEWLKVVGPSTTKHVRVLLTIISLSMLFLGSDSTFPHQTFTCSKSTIETVEKVVKYVQSQL